MGASALATLGMPTINLRASSAVARTVVLGPASGDVGPSEATLWARPDGAGALFYRVSTSPDLTTGLSLGVEASPDHGFTGRLPLQGLQPATRYHYAAVAGRLDDEPAAVLDRSLEQGLLAKARGSFRTPPANSDSGEAVFTWGGDLGAAYRPFSIFDAARRDQPDFHLLLGDTMYADHGWRATSLDDYRRKYWENLSDPHLQAFARATPWWVIWDDHEVDNDFDSTWNSMPAGRQAFQEAWPIRRNSDEPGRLYRSFRWGRLAEFFIVDTRQYRSAAATADGPLRTLLGREQLAWLRHGLLNSTANLKFVVSSGPLRYASKDCWPGFGFERDRLLRFVTENRIAGVTFLTGDMHYGAVVEHQEGITEVTVGPMAQNPHDNSHVRGQRGVRYTYNGGVSYGRAHLRPTPTGAEVFLSMRDHTGKSLHEIRVAA